LPHFFGALDAGEGGEVPDARGGRLGRVRGLSRASEPLQLGGHVAQALELGPA
jgi:hypothetical protein